MRHSLNTTGSSLLMGFADELQVVLGMCRHRHFGNLPNVKVLKAEHRLLQPSHWTSLMISLDTSRESNPTRLNLFHMKPSVAGGSGNETLSNLSKCTGLYKK